MDANLVADLLPSQFQGQLTALAGGLTNRSWRLDTAQQSYWLRLGNAHSASLGIDRKLELVAHQAAADAGLAPIIHYADPKRGLLVLDWIPEPDWQSVALHSAVHLDMHSDEHKPQPPKPDLGLLMTKVAQLHRLTPPLGHLHLAQQATLYWRQLTSVSPELQGYRQSFAQAPLNLDYEPVFCHHDLNGANILGAKPWLIDWEYAALGDAAFELAVIADSFQLSAPQARQLLADYNRAGGAVCEQRLMARRPWVQWLSALWSAVQYQHTGQANYQQLYDLAIQQLGPCLADVLASK